MAQVTHKEMNLSTLFRLLFFVTIVFSFISSSGPGRSENHAFAQDYSFSGGISRRVLENYLSRSITMSDMFLEQGDLDDNIRMLSNIGAKFAGRTVFLWAGEAQLPNILTNVRNDIPKVHNVDPEMILQAAIFEIVTTDVESLPIPDWVFQNFGLPVETRGFDYESMLFDSGSEIDFYGPGASVPDMTKLETRLWFFYLAASYIDMGVEAIHLGQLGWMAQLDTDYANVEGLLGRIRNYATQKARRKYVVLDAHVNGMVRNGNLLLDFHSSPLRIKEVAGSPPEGMLEVDYCGGIYRNSEGGISPSGWYAQSAPYLVELDHGYGRGSVVENIGCEFIWGYDEISWFSLRSDENRNDFLRYAWNWVRQNDPNGYLQMPGMRPIFINTLPHTPDWYYANTPSAAVPNGYNQEGTIKKIWQSSYPTSFLPSIFLLLE